MIIGLIGYKQVGKSTAAEYLQKKFGLNRVNFKDALVREMKNNLPDTLRELGSIYDLSTDQLFHEKPAAMRALMQNYGTEIRRGDDPEYWTKQWAEAVDTHHAVVCDDVRFINEAETVKAQGGFLVRLSRPDIINGGEHASETEQDTIVADFTITVDKGDHDGLYRELDLVYERIEEQLFKMSS